MAQPRITRALPRITERQWQVAELVALGYGNQAIADELGIGVGGVKYHISEILHRVGLAGREEVGEWFRAERLARGNAVSESVFAPRVAPPELVAMSREQDWPLGLLDRAMELQVAAEQVERWLARSATRAEVERWLDDHERLMFGTLRVRQATWLDNEAIAETYAHAPEPDGEWMVTFERGPYSFAQSRLQERPHVQVVEDRGVILGAVSRAYPRLRVAGELYPFEYQSGFVVRSEARGWGVSRLISHVPRPSSAWPANASFYLVRPKNMGGHSWLRAKGRTTAILADDATEDVPGVPVTVHHLVGTRHEAGGDATGIRPAERADLDRCATLIVARREGFDFVAPATAWTLDERLSSAGAAPRDVFWPHVYGYGDFFVVERDGRIVACAGLWDAGRDLREVWRHQATGRRRVVDSTMVLDPGFEDGCEAEFVRLLDYLAERSDGLGRNRMTVPLVPLGVPEALLEGWDVRTETRSLQFTLDEAADRLPPVRPFIDLAYW